MTTTVALDHLVLASTSLDEGIAYLKEVLGVAIPRGGEHERYGTHNCLMRLDHEDNKTLYFEVIAINPDAVPQVTPRWFSLDDHHVRSQLSESPKLVAWVMNTRQIDVAATDPMQTDSHLTRLSRGELNWQMLVPQSGKPSDPLLPWVIQWPVGVHPATSMPVPECRLVSLDVYHRDPIDYCEALDRLGAGDLISSHVIEQSGVSGSLEATLASPNGQVRLPGIVWN